VSNLIITIISIALIAVIAIAGIYYGGTALTQSQGKIYASTLMAQSRQLMAINTQYMLDHGFSTFNDFGPDAPVVDNYLQGRMPILSLDVESQGISGAASPTLNSAGTRHHMTCNGASGQFSDALNGYQVQGSRANGNIFGANVILYAFGAPPSSACGIVGAQDFAPASMTNHPLVQMCAALNAMTTLPAGLTYSASGLPEAPGGVTWGAPFYLDYYNNLNALNTCFIIQHGSWGTGYPEMLYIFAN